MCILNRHQFMQYVLYKSWRKKTNLQTLLVKWLCTKNTIPQCMQQPFATIVAFFERCVALLSNFRENPPIYVLNHFRNHSIPVGKCSMLFCKIEFLFSLLQHCFEKSAILLSKGPCKTFVNKVAHSLKHVFYSIWTCRFLFAKCAAFLSESVARAYCRFHWWCKSLFKRDVFFFLFTASAAPTFAIFPKEYSCSMEILLCFEQGAMWLAKGLQNVQYLCTRSRVWLETTQSKLFTVNTCYMPMQRVQ